MLLARSLLWCEPLNRFCRGAGVVMNSDFLVDGLISIVNACPKIGSAFARLYVAGTSSHNIFSIVSSFVSRISDFTFSLERMCHVAVALITFVSKSTDAFQYKC